MPDTPLGRFCWHELMTTDPAGAKDFYPKVTGWGTEEWDGGPTPYTMWMNGQEPVGGVMALPAEAGDTPPHWLAYVSTPDCDATIAKAEELGGCVVWGPMDLPEVGRVAGIADPQGAMIALHEPAGDAPGRDGAEPVGGFSWHELATDRWKDAYAFYTELFGWEDAGDFDMGPEMGMYQMFANTGNAPDSAPQLGGMFDRPDEVPVSAWLGYIRVADLEKALAAVTANGGQVMSGPMEVPGGDHVAQCVDPQGVMFALHQTAA